MKLIVQPGVFPYFDVVDVEKSIPVIRASYCTKEEAELFAAAPAMRDSLRKKNSTPPRFSWTVRAKGRVLIHAGQDARRNGWRGGEAITPFYSPRFQALFEWLAKRK